MFRESKTGVSPPLLPDPDPAPPHPPPHKHTHVECLLTVPRRFLCCSSSLFGCWWFHTCMCHLFCHCLFPTVLPLAPWEGCATWLWHFLGILTYLYILWVSQLLFSAFIWLFLGISIFTFVLLIARISPFFLYNRLFYALQKHASYSNILKN